jgi:hypothetical protein
MTEAKPKEVSQQQPSLQNRNRKSPPRTWMKYLCVLSFSPNLYRRQAKLETQIHFQHFATRERTERNPTAEREAKKKT